MSKRFRNEACVYCSVAKATTGDHVFARNFFLNEDRDRLPQVPACSDCNNAKSQLEHYLTTVLPFGGRHSNSRRMLAEMVPGRLAKNRKLHHAIRASMTPIWTDQGGYAVRTTAIAIDPEKTRRLVELIVRGLVWHHWQVRLGQEYFVDVMLLAPGRADFFERFFRGAAAQHVEANLGHGTFEYEGIQAVDDAHITAWRLSGYGRAQFGDPTQPGAAASVFGVLTGPGSAKAEARRTART